MAVWKLIEPHYLMVPEHYWEQQETDRDTGRKKIKKYPVPTHLNPKDPSDWTHKTGLDVTRGGDSFADGDIIVAWAEGYVYERPEMDDPDAVFADDGTKFWPAGAPLVGDPPKPDRRILIFEGPPTMGMEPIDDEAREIMKHFKWKDVNKDKYFGMSYAERLVFDTVTKPKDENKALEAMGELMRELAAVTAQNSQLLAELAKQGRRL